jgi:hypothetical protein
MKRNEHLPYRSGRRWPAEQSASRCNQNEQHLTPEQAGHLASGPGGKMVVMAQLPPAIEPHEDYQRFIAGLKQSFTAGSWWPTNR